METVYFNSPIGTIQISSSENGITSLVFRETKSGQTSPGLFLADCFQQLEAYFNGELKQFDLPIDLKGTEFQVKVWKELFNIPFGKTITYMELAKRLGDPKSIRAAAHANAKNPISIIVPCHRVIGSDGSLTGYVGGLWRKKWLLDHEQNEQQGKLF